MGDSYLTGSQYFNVSHSKSDWDIVANTPTSVNYLQNLGFKVIYNGQYFFNENGTNGTHQYILEKRVKRWFRTKYKINIMVPLSKKCYEQWLAPTVLGKLRPYLVQTKEQRAKLFNDFHKGCYDSNLSEIF